MDLYGNLHFVNIVDFWGKKFGKHVHSDNIMSTLLILIAETMVITEAMT